MKRENEIAKGNEERNDFFSKANLSSMPAYVLKIVSFIIAIFGGTITCVFLYIIGWFFNFITLGYIFCFIFLGIAMLFAIFNTINIALENLNHETKKANTISWFLTYTFAAIGYVFFIADMILEIVSSYSKTLGFESTFDFEMFSIVYLQAFFIAVTSVIGVASIYFAIKQNEKTKEINELKLEIDELKIEVAKLKKGIKID